MSLPEELRDLARRIADCPNDEVADLAMDVANWYRRERLAALGLAAVDSMIADGPEEIDNENDPLLEAVRERFRDRLRSLVEWAKATGRM